MSGRDARIEFQIAQPPAQLRLTDPAIAQEQDLNLGVDVLSGLKV